MSLSITQKLVQNKLTHSVVVATRTAT